MIKKKKKKKGYYKVAGFCAIVGCVAALLWGAGYFGLGGGGGDGFGLPFTQSSGNNGSGGQENNQAHTQTPPPQDTQEPQEPQDENGEGQEDPAPELVIRVVHDAIYHGQQEITLDDLVPLLERLNQPGYVWELHDDRAIVETYETVVAIMRENAIEFVER